MRRYTIIGCGKIGMEVARRWSAAGHLVRGTTTSPERVPELASVCAETMVLRGNDDEQVKRAVAGADAVVLSVSPRLSLSLTRRDRNLEYRTTLVGSARTAVSYHRRVIFLSSISVYGDGGPGHTTVDESTPLTIDLEPSAQNFAAAERMVLEYASGAALRLPDVVGHPDHMDLATQVRRAHRHLDGTLPFAPGSLAYRLDYRDAAAAVTWVVERGLTGVYNVVPDDVVPPTYEGAFGEAADAQGMPRLTLRGEIKRPVRPVSSARLRSTGFAFDHPVR